MNPFTLNLAWLELVAKYWGWSAAYTATIFYAAHAKPGAVILPFPASRIVRRAAGVA